MTCVVGIRSETGALLALDSFSGNSQIVAPRADLKGRLINDWLALGYTTSYRFGQILCWHLDLKKPPKEPQAYEWMVTSFVPAARNALREHGWLKKENEREEAGHAIVAVGRQVFVMQSDLQVEEPGQAFCSVGAGDTVALGALHALDALGHDHPPAGLAALALEAAAVYNPWVRPPWHFLETRAL